MKEAKNTDCAIRHSRGFFVHTAMRSRRTANGTYMMYGRRLGSRYESPADAYPQRSATTTGLADETALSEHGPVATRTCNSESKRAANDCFTRPAARWQPIHPRPRRFAPAAETKSKRSHVRSRAGQCFHVRQTFREIRVAADGFFRLFLAVVSGCREISIIEFKSY